MSDLQPLQKLQFAQRPVPASDIGDKGELAWLPLSQLYVDPAYQRAILDSGKANIRRMIEAFSWLQFGTLVVSRRTPSRYAVIDGQHRATAAMLHGGIDKVPCLILKGGREAEARAFAAINGNVTRIHPLQSFRANVAAGDGAAREIVDLCARGGVTIAPYPKMDPDPGETMALGSIRQVRKNYNDAILIAAFKLLRAAEPEAGIGAAAIIGAAKTLSVNPQWARDPKLYGGKLADRGGIAALSTKARARKATHGGPEWSSFHAVLTDAVNLAIRTAGLPLNKMMAGR
jgi:hypothetical protein